VPQVGSQNQTKFIKLSNSKVSKEEPSFSKERSVKSGGESFLAAVSLMSQEERKNKFD
jgi:hypothetical protein